MWRIACWVIVIAGCSHGAEVAPPIAHDLAMPAVAPADAAVDGCTVVLAGARSGTFACSVLVSQDILKTDYGLILTVADAAPLSAIHILIGRSGSPLLGTFVINAGDANTYGDISVADGDAAWTIPLVGDGGLVTLGTFTLTATFIGALPDGGGDIVYQSINGSLVSTLPAMPGSSAAGDLTLVATF